MRCGSQNDTGAPGGPREPGSKTPPAARRASRGTHITHGANTQSHTVTDRDSHDQRRPNHPSAQAQGQRHIVQAHNRSMTSNLTQRKGVGERFYSGFTHNPHHLSLDSARSTPCGRARGSGGEGVTRTSHWVCFCLALLAPAHLALGVFSLELGKHAPRQPQQCPQCRRMEKAEWKRRSARESSPD